MKVKDVKHKVTLDDFEHRLLVGCVNAARTMYLEQNKPTEDVDDLLVKIIKAPSKKVSVRVRYYSCFQNKFPCLYFVFP